MESRRGLDVVGDDVDPPAAPCARRGSGAPLHAGHPLELARGRV